MQVIAIISLILNANSAAQQLLRGFPHTNGSLHCRATMTKEIKNTEKIILSDETVNLLHLSTQREIEVDHSSPVLALHDGHAYKDQFSLDDPITSIGREPQNDIVLSDPACSRKHCELRQVDGEWFVHDLDSRNGTRVNGERIDGVKMLRDGDHIRIGKLKLLFSAELNAE